MNNLLNKRSFVIVLGCLTGLGALTIDMSLPSIPDMAASLTTTISIGQQIVGVFIAGIAIGQIPAGLISDRIGRIPVLIVGMVIFTAAGIITSLANNIEIMLIARFFQGIGASVGIVLSRAMVRDIASGIQAARLLSILVMIFTVTPIIAPIVGSYLAYEYGWRSTFVIITLFGFLMIVGVNKGLVETKKPDKTNKISRQLIESITTFFSYRQSILGMLLVVLPSIGFMSLITGSASLIIEIFKFPVEMFGFIFALAGISTLLGSLLNRKLLLQYSVMQLTGAGVAIITIASIQLTLIAWFNSENFFWLWSCVCLFMFGNGFVVANATAVALDPVPKISGVAASIVGTCQNLSTAIGSIFASMIYNGTVLNSIILMCIFGIITFVAYLLRSRILGDQIIYMS